MSDEDRRHWDRRYESAGVAPRIFEVPGAFEGWERHVPTKTHALELACGRGRGAVWLAGRGLEVQAVDVSAEAIALATRLAESVGVAPRCRFDVHDLDLGLPDGEPADVVMCHLFRDRRLDGAVVERLAPGGVLLMACLSEVGAGPGRFRVAAGELVDSFGTSLEVIEHREADGMAALVARRP